MKLQNVLILSIGILLIFISLYIFTRPAIFESWDFSSTGQVGDTIGGITAPLINLIGAFLVYISFQAQINANRIQSQALEDEKKRNSTNNQFEKYLSLFEDIKSRLRDLEFVVESPGHSNSDGSFTQPVHIVYNGLNALNEYVQKIEAQKQSNYFGGIYSTYGIFLNFQFMLTAILDLIERIEKNVQNSNDKEFLFNNIKLFYKGFLLQFGNRILDIYASDDSQISELKRIKEIIDIKFGA
ncbi:MAG: hypothetical protein DRJ01_09330 [Bacteroidetes bacterium]|nr:MAG: hypothetical protein DRJ01_09330 [Bacteroidota bacterium]